MASIINAATSGGLVTTADTSGVLQLQTASTTAVTVDASQNVGIGTASPEQKLDVVGALNLRNSGRRGTFEIDSSGNLWMGTATTAGNLIFETGHSGGSLPSTGTERVKINQYGIGLGLATPSSGMGITFPATQSASSNANTLDDYEEGTWTPEMSFGNDTTGITYSTQVGTYEKIGRQVTLRCHICFTNNGSGSGIAKLSGFPFTLLAGANAAAAFSIFTDVTLSGTYYASAVPQASQTFAYFRMSDAYMTETQFTNTANFTFMTSYNV
jgi:hypothetical protein